jgi:hypothetical protein
VSSSDIQYSMGTSKVFKPSLRPVYEDSVTVGIFDGEHIILYTGSISGWYPGSGWDIEI